MRDKGSTGGRCYTSFPLFPASVTSHLLSFLTSNIVLRKESALNYLQLSMNKFKRVGVFLLKAFIGASLALCLVLGRKLKM